MKLHRTVDQILEQQIHEWEQRTSKRAESRGPVVTVSRLPGSGGRVFAKKLAEAAKLDLFDREIVAKIAESTKLSETLVSSLDERIRPVFTDWLLNIEKERFLWPHEYLEHLIKVVGAINQHGRAVILGRGSAFILGKGESLRVSVVAPLALRVKRVAEEHKIDEREAHKQVILTENERMAFNKRSFNVDMTDPENFDLVINTEYVSIDDAVAITIAAIESRWKNC